MSRRTVHPTPGTYLAGIPRAPIIAERDVARRLIETGAYQNAPDHDAEELEPVELTDEQSALLPFFHNIETEPEPEAEPAPAEPPAEEPVP